MPSGPPERRSGGVLRDLAACWRRDPTTGPNVWNQAKGALALAARVAVCAAPVVISPPAGASLLVANYCLGSKRRARVSSRLVLNLSCCAMMCIFAPSLPLTLALLEGCALTWAAGRKDDRPPAERLREQPPAEQPKGIVVDADYRVL